MLVEAGEQVELGEAQLAGPLGVPSTQAPDGRHRSLEGRCELAERLRAVGRPLVARRRARRGHAGHAGAAVSISRAGASATIFVRLRAVRSARTSTMHGTIASAVRTTVHQNAAP